MWSAQQQLRTSPTTRSSSDSSRSEEHTSELQSLAYLVCRLLLEKKKNNTTHRRTHRNILFHLTSIPSPASLADTASLEFLSIAATARALPCARLPSTLHVLTIYT